MVGFYGEIPWELPCVPRAPGSVWWDAKGSHRGIQRRPAGLLKGPRGFPRVPVCSRGIPRDSMGSLVFPPGIPLESARIPSVKLSAGFPPWNFRQDLDFPQ